MDGDRPFESNRGHGRVSETAQLYMLTQRFECFHDGGQPYVRWKERDGVLVTAPARERRIGAVLTEWYEQEYREHPAVRLVESVSRSVVIDCSRSGPQRTVCYRSSWCEPEEDGEPPGIAYDLGNRTWGAMVVSPDAIEYREPSPVPFRRPKGMLELPSALPPPEGDTRSAMDILQDIAPLPDTDSELIRLAFILSSMWPAGPYPILKLVGPTNCGKTLHASIIRMIVDPCQSYRRGYGKDEESLIAAAADEKVVLIDNVSEHISWLPGALCRLTTGTGSKRRNHYEDDLSDIVACTAVMLTSVEDTLLSPEIVSRSLLIELPAIGGIERWSESWVLSRLEEEMPYLLYRLFELLQLALCAPRLRSYNSRFESLYRIMQAVEPALGLYPGSWQRAHRRDTSDMHNTVLRSLPPYLDALRSILTDAEDHGKSYWEGTIGDLLVTINRNSPDIAVKGTDWPRSTKALGTQLRSSRDSLLDLGFEISEPRKSRTGYIVRISRPGL